MITSLAADLRSAFRTLVAARGFTGVALATLTGGLALVIVVLALVNAYLVRALPYPGADRLYNVRYGAPGQDRPQRLETLDWSSIRDVADHQIAWDLDMFYMLGARYPESVAGAWVTPGFVEGLGIRPARGRGFSDADYTRGAPQVAIVSHRLWQTRFRADPAIVGRTFQAYVSDRPEEAETFTIVGVLPEGFWHLNRYTDVFAPLRTGTYPYFVRLSAGADPATAADRITSLVRAGGLAPTPAWRATLSSVHGDYVLRVRPMLAAVGIAAGFVLLLACANVAVLILVRATKRARDVAVRLALGASGSRIARLLAIEGLLLGGVATLAALALSHAALGQLAPFIQTQLGRPVPGGLPALGIDGTVAALAVACGVFTSCAFMLGPLVAVWRTDLLVVLQGGSRASTDRPAARRWRTGLVALEVALSLALLCASALMIESAVRMLRADSGLRAAGVFTTQVAIRERSYPDRASQGAFLARLHDRMQQVPGVRMATMGDYWPLQESGPRRVEASGPAGRVEARPSIVAVAPRYFEALGIRVLDGREFAAADRLESSRVAIVSESLARRLWPGAAAVGQPIVLEGEELEQGQRAPAESHLVVGVVRDVRQTPADANLVDVYVPLFQQPGRFAFLYIVGDGGATSAWDSALRTAVAGIDPAAALGTPASLEAALDEQRAAPRFLAGLLSAFAAIAGVLALVGLYGVIAYSARQREREIAIRLAVGADGPAITRLVARQGAVMIAVGLAAGLVTAVAVGRVLESQLFGVQPGELRVLVLASLAVAFAGAVAVWWPARRAAATDPAAALRAE